MRALLGEQVVRIVSKQLWVGEATTPLDTYPSVGGPLKGPGGPAHRRPSLLQVPL